jgi:hypothetical protein
MGNGVKMKKGRSGKKQPAQKGKNKAAWEARSEVIDMLPEGQEAGLQPGHRLRGGDEGQLRCS